MTWILGLWLLAASPAADRAALTSPEHEQVVLEGLAPRPAVWTTRAGFDVGSLRMRAGLEVARVCSGEPTGEEQGAAAVEALVAEIEPLLAGALDDGHVELMKAMLTIEEAGWRAASAGIPTGPCLVEQQRWRERAERLAREIIRADQQAQVLLLEEPTLGELEMIVAGARLGPRLRIEARIAGIRAGVEWARALAAQIRADPRPEKVRRCARFYLYQHLPSQVESAIMDAVRACEEAGL